MNHTQLTARLQTWTVNNDAEFVAEIDEIIGLAEQRISKELSVDAMILHKTTPLTASSAFLDKPSDAVSVSALRLDGSDHLEFRTTSYLADYWPDRTVTGTPKYYANWDEDTIVMAPTPVSGDTVEMEYEVRITGLSSSVLTTWISVNHADLLFYACLLESGAFMKASTSEERYGKLYDRSLTTAKAEVDRIRSDATSTRR